VAYVGRGLPCSKWDTPCRRDDGMENNEIKLSSNGEKMDEALRLLYEQTDAGGAPGYV